MLAYSPHITVLTETWLHEGVSDAEIVPRNFTVYRRDRPSRGGGVAVILSTHVMVTPLKQIDDHESLCLKLSVFGNSIILLAAYRSPTSDDDFLSKIYDFCVEYSGSRLILTGDFNLPNINWSKLSSSSSSDHVVFDLMLACDLEQAVNVPTRVQNHASSILDLVFYSKCLSEVHVSVDDGLSDHKLVFFTCSLGNQPDNMHGKQKVFKKFF